MGSLRLGNIRINPAVVIPSNNTTLSATANGNYRPSAGYTGFSSVVVSVASVLTEINATNDKTSAVAVNDKVWLNNVSGTYHIVEFASATADSTIGYVTQAAASGGTAKVSIFTTGKEIDLSNYNFTNDGGNVTLNSYTGSDPDVVVPNV